ncbi:hypothetical protein [Lysinibacillus xylanilyticus]|uniref:hypothetical protein n=1 Tax=Lysinibacillus xylanilyticus TaxID=582475 RepID=UPI002B23F40B|nr:hypothetical protein [Lysinibacillus xylanilyticus]
MDIRESEGEGTVCLNERCDSFNESNGSDTKEILTKDEYILIGFQCDHCHEISFTTLDAWEYDSTFDYDALENEGMFDNLKVNDKLFIASNRSGYDFDGVYFVSQSSDSITDLDYGPNRENEIPNAYIVEISKR